MTLRLRQGPLGHRRREPVANPAAGPCDDRRDGRWNDRRTLAPPTKGCSSPTWSAGRSPSATAAASSPSSRAQRPRHAIEIDPAAAPWVEQAFRWYADDRLSIGEIVRRFNGDPKIPRSPRGVNGRWSHEAIRYMLANPRYRGRWEYGARENVFQSKQDYTRRVPRDQPLQARSWRTSASCPTSSGTGPAAPTRPIAPASAASPGAAIPDRGPG